MCVCVGGGERGERGIGERGGGGGGGRGEKEKLLKKVISFTIFISCRICVRE